jgi:asparagine synthase (glutamine-hydrolysing)
LHASHHASIRDNCDWYYAQHFQQNLSPLKAIQYMDIKCFMGELVLTKVDRASMANSLEVRVPFLNHQLFEKIFGLAESQYYKPEQTKALLFEQIKTVFPKQILQRKKQGFVGPDVFYQNLPFYQNVLQSSCLVEDNLINAETVKRYIETRQTWKLWKIVVMEFWYRRWVRKSSV